MRRLALAFAMIAVLSACDAQTPLTRGLAALKKGDHAQLLEAKAEAAQDLKTAIQPDGDMCMATMLDVQKYGAVSILNRMDKPDIFKLPDESRLVYALKLAGVSPPIEEGSPLTKSWFYTAVMDEDNAPSCAGKRNQIMANAILNNGSDVNEARMLFLRRWMKEAKDRHGADFDNRMRSAAATIRGVGYSAEWPVRIDFITD
jgi:hypothetical protein